MNYKKHGSLLVPVEPDPAEQARKESVLKAYNSNPELKKRADQIHSQRMLSGDACTDCIEKAAHRLGITI